MLSLPLDPLAREVPRSVQPESATAFAVTIGWLLDAVEHHRLPNDPANLTPRLRQSDDFRLSFARVPGAVPAGDCHSVRHALVLDLHEGDVFGVRDNDVVVGPVDPTLVGVGPRFGIGRRHAGDGARATSGECDSCPRHRAQLLEYAMTPAPAEASVGAGAQLTRGSGVVRGVVRKA